MWTPTTRQQHSRTVIRYQTDLTDAEERVIAPLLAEPRASSMARPSEFSNYRELNGVFSISSRLVTSPWHAWPILIDGKSLFDFPAAGDGPGYLAATLRADCHPDFYCKRGKSSGGRLGKSTLQAGTGCIPSAKVDC